MIRDAHDRRDKIDALTIRFAVGEISEAVFTARLKGLVRDPDDIRHLVILNQTAHRSSLPYRRGDVA